MNRFLWFLRGYCMVWISGASVQWVLNQLSKERIPFWDPELEDPFTMRISIFPRDLEAVTDSAEKSQCAIQKVQTMGIGPHYRNLFCRPALLTIVLLTVVSLWLLPNYLMFFEVSGNSAVPEEMIKRELEYLGVGFGTYGPSVKPQWIKDHLLNTISNLQWVTVTQNGCIAQVVVRERPETPQTLDRSGYAHVYAIHDGMIVSQSILAGQPLKQVGDFVTEGEMLVSGLVDLERVWTMEYAQAEIYARTWRKFSVQTPETYTAKKYTGGTNHCIWFEIGKRRIKIFGNSGISAVSCDKMISRKILSLPGGLTLPMSILVEVFQPWNGSSVKWDAAAVQLQQEMYLRDRVLAAMNAGEILKQQLSMKRHNGYYQLQAVVECREMISKTVEAKWNKEDFADD